MPIITEETPLRPAAGWPVRYENGNKFLSKTPIGLGLLGGSRFLADHLKSFEQPESGAPTRTSPTPGTHV
ncbi:MAG: hypothetical protein AABY34_05375 [Pseudomonadota bacterium]